MEWIIQPIDLVDRICGSQTKNKEKRYRFNRHCIDVSVGEKTLIYHSMTGALVLLHSADDYNANIDALINKWFMVPEEFNEREMADAIKKVASFLKPSMGLKTDFTILTTTDCNARCFYCYERSIQHMSMTADTAKAVSKYISSKCGKEKLKIRWFGGEPLYNTVPIDCICDELTRQGKEFESSMITNGYYLSRETIHKARRLWNLRKVQITIDGTEQMYNKTKAYIHSEENPYRRVMNNIMNTIEADIVVTIRMNMDAHNAEDLIQLVDDIAVRFKGKKNLSVYLARLHQFENKISEFQTEELEEKYYQLISNRITFHQLQKPSRLPHEITVTSCMADNDHAEVILPDGRVGRCEHYNDKMITGNVWDKKRNHDVEAQWKKHLNVPECQECVLYPQCNNLQECEWYTGGCSRIDRNIRINELKTQMLQSYINLKGEAEINEIKK